MSIDLAKLMRLEIPTVRQELVPRDIALYALSIGMGRDPQDTRQLPHVDPLQGPQVMLTLLRKPANGCASLIPGRTYPTPFVTGMPRAVSPFRTAMRTWSSATCRSKSRAKNRCQKLQTMHFRFDAAPIRHV